MKLISRINIYKGPETREEILELSEKLIRSGWQTKIYDPEKLLSYGPPRGEISGEIFGLNEELSDENSKCYSIKLGTIELGRIETRNKDRRLEDFLANYQFQDILKGGKK